jgi:hypothetical protein
MPSNGDIRDWWAHHRFAADKIVSRRRFAEDNIALSPPSFSCIAISLAYGQGLDRASQASSHVLVPWLHTLLSYSEQ